MMQSMKKSNLNSGLKGTTEIPQSIAFTGQQCASPWRFPWDINKSERMKWLVKNKHKANASVMECAQQREERPALPLLDNLETRPFA